MANRGDTLCLMLNYNLNGNPLVQGAYQEIELQINKDSATKEIKKLLSNGDIKWGTVLKEDGTEWTGYYADMSQDETFKLNAGPSQVQLRIKKDGEVGSSKETTFQLGTVLSSKVL